MMKSMPGMPKLVRAAFSRLRGSIWDRSGIRLIKNVYWIEAFDGIILCVSADLESIKHVTFISFLFSTDHTLSARKVHFWRSESCGKRQTKTDLSP